MVVPFPQTLDDAKAVILNLNDRVAELEKQVAWFKKQIFGRRSEKQSCFEDLPGDQLNMFGAEATEEEAREEAEVPAPRKNTNTRRRRHLPESAPRVDVVLDVPEEEKVCACCGKQKERIGEDVTEQLDIVPAQVFVRRQIRPKYACSACRDGVVQTPLPEQPIKRGIAAPGFLAYMVLSKYADHIPLCRMEKIFARNDIDITRSNMSEWAMQLHRLCMPLIALILRRILTSAVIHSDDTTLRVQQPGGGIKRSYLWVYLGDESAPYTFYNFTEGRSRAGPNAILSEFSGFLQADAYTGYEELYKLTSDDGSPQIIESGCWAHARRYFVQADESGDARARHAIEEIAKLFAIEKQAKKECAEKTLNDLHTRRLELRRETSIAILENLFAWMDDRLDVLPQSPLGKAIGYAQNNKTALYTYTTDGRLEIDNNAAERAMRPVAIGRKNWLFAGSNQGGQAAATFFTLIESAKRNGLNPYDFLRDLFKRLPGHPINQIDDFLPGLWASPENKK